MPYAERPGTIGDIQPAHPYTRFGMRYLLGPGRNVDRVLHEGDEVAGFTVLEVRGHSPGHLAFWRERDGVLIVGDVINNMNILTGLPGPPRAATVRRRRPRGEPPLRAQARRARAQGHAVRPRESAARHAEVRRLRGGPVRTPDRLAAGALRTADALDRLELLDREQVLRPAGGTLHCDEVLDRRHGDRERAEVEPLRAPAEDLVVGAPDGTATRSSGPAEVLEGEELGPARACARRARTGRARRRRAASPRARPSAFARASRLPSSRAKQMSTSWVRVADPCSTAARPPMST